MTQESLFSGTVNDSNSAPAGLGQAIPHTASLMENAIALNIEIGRLGTRRKVNSSEIIVDADKELIHVSKEILESKSLDLIKKEDGVFRTWLDSRALPAPMLRKGFKLIGLNLIAEVDEKTEDYRKRRAMLVAAFLDDYEDSKARAREKLRSQFREDEYPPVESVRKAFSVAVSYMEFGVPGRLRQIRPDLFAREMQEMHARIANATEEIEGVLRASMADLTAHLIDRLKPAADGTQKIFRDSLVGNLKDFLATFDARNITNDQELAAVVKKARDLIDGVDPKTLRDDTTLRQQTAEGFTEVKALLDTMLVNKPVRVVDFDQD